MVLPSQTPRILLTSMQQLLQITPPLPTTVPDSRSSRPKMRGSEWTSPLTTLTSTTCPSDWEISGVLSWRPNPVPVDLMGSTTTNWNTSLRTHLRSSKRFCTSNGSLVISLSGGQQQWSLFQNQTRTTLTHSITDQSHLLVVYARSWSAWLTHFIWYLKRYGILDKSQCGFRKHRSTMDHLVSLKRYVRDAFARKQQVVGLSFDLEKAYKTTWQYGIIRDLHRIGLRGRLPVF